MTTTNPRRRDVLRGCESIPSDIKKLAGAETLAEAWQKCEDGRELIRLCGAMVGSEGWPTKQEILLVVCECAETVLPYVREEETWSRECIRVSRLWAEGKTTAEEIAGVGKIAAYGLSIWSSTPDARVPSGVRSGAAQVAYSVGYAASYAAGADTHTAAGHADQASSSSFAFMCITYGVPLFTAIAFADAAGAQGSAIWRDAQSESLKKTADLVRARLHPTAWAI